MLAHQPSVNAHQRVIAVANAASKAIMENTKIVGLRIAEGRKKLGLSQAQFAQKVNMSQQAVGKWERGESLPDIFMLAKIGKVIGHTDICYFVGKDPCSCDCGCCACCPP